MVYSAHDYAFYSPPWVASDVSEAELWNVFWQAWGFVSEVGNSQTGPAPVLLGEFGTRNGLNSGDGLSQASDVFDGYGNPYGTWFHRLTRYLELQYRRFGSGHWLYWPLNGRYPGGGPEAHTRESQIPFSA